MCKPGVQAASVQARSASAMAKAPKREVTRDHERRAWELRVREHLTEQAIAERLGVAESTVCRMLQRIEKRLAGEFRDRAAQIKAEQTAQLQALARVALEGYRRSTEDAVTERVTTRTVTIDGEATITDESGKAH